MSSKLNGIQREGKEEKNDTQTSIVKSVPSQESSAAPTISSSRTAYTQETFNTIFGSIPPEEAKFKEKVKYTGSKICSSLRRCCSPRPILKTAYGYLPFIETVRTYKFKENIVGDMVAGLSVGMVHIPQAMGFALLAGVAPVYGLYSTFYQVLIYMLFGHCRHLSLGTMAVISLIIGAAVEREAIQWKNNQIIVTDDMGMVNSTIEPAEREGLTIEDRFRASVASGVSMIAGFTMLIMGVCRLGVLTTFMPPSFIGGFTTAAGFHIKATQLKSMLNVPVKRYGGIFNYPRSMIAIFKALPLTHIPDLIISIICFTFLVLIKEIVNVRFKKKLPFPIPAEMLVVIIATLVSYLADLNGQYGVKVIGFIPKGIPGPVMPNLEHASSYILEGIVAGVTSFAISISMVNILTKKYRYTVDPNKELVAYGLSYGISSFFHCFVGAAAPPRCFVMDLTGGKTQVTSVVTTVLLLLVLLVIAPVFRYLPNACLGCIIVVALFPLFKQFTTLPRIFKVSKPDFCIWMITFLVSTIFDVSVSLGVGMLVAIFTLVLPSMSTNGYQLNIAESPDLYAPVTRYTKLKNGGHIVVFRYECTLYYLTIKNFKKQLFSVAFDPLLINMESDSQSTTEIPDSKMDGPLNKVAIHMNHVKESKMAPNNESVKGLPCVIILDCSPVCYTDLLGVNTLTELKDDYEATGVDLMLAHCNLVFVDKLKTAGVYDKFRVFPTVQDAMAFCNEEMKCVETVEDQSVLTVNTEVEHNTFL